MTWINHGGPAFPVVAENGLGHVSDGMTLRDYFAAKALCGILSDSGIHHVGSQPVAKALAKTCFMIADAMILERSK